MVNQVAQLPHPGHSHATFFTRDRFAVPGVGVVLMYFVRSSHSTSFTIRQAGWGPNDVCINEGGRPWKKNGKALPLRLTDIQKYV